jgi:Uma2 family endonuclease
VNGHCAGIFNPLNTITAMRIGHYLNAFVIPNDFGYVTGADGAFRLTPRVVRQPDVTYIAKARVTAPLPDHFEVAPDLAVEVVSPNEDAFQKTLEYLHAGTQLVWLVYAQQQEIHVVQLDEDGGMRSFPHTLARNDALDGGTVLPGLNIPLHLIFPP